jgi:hypothetical protein
MALDLTVSYTPRGSDLAVTLAVIRDASLLVAALQTAIEEADWHALTEADPVAATGYRTQRDFLRKCLQAISCESSTGDGIVM